MHQHKAYRITKTQKLIAMIGGTIVLLIIIGFAIARYHFLLLAYKQTKTEALYTEQYLQTKIHTLETQLSSTTNENIILNNNLIAEQNRNDAFQQQINGISSTVGTLVKLSQTDKELLQKYSKVYFLNENFVPNKLSIIPISYNLDKNKILEFHTNALPYLERMIDDASRASTTIQLASAYRSFGTQEALKTSYKVTYGSGTANSFSADQGYSEHQLGTAVDVITPSMNGALTTKFDATPAFKWLNDNAYKYGFILSYPKGNTYYQYEPWHWRFVGIALATRLHNENKHFYDLEQRDIDTYLVNIFD